MNRYTAQYDGWWLIYPDGRVDYLASANRVWAAVRKAEQSRVGPTGMVAAQITWINTPAGFEPPQEGIANTRKA